MSAYIVTYDLNQQGQNSNCIIERLKAYPTHWHMQQSVWIVVTDQNHIEIRNNLMGCLDSNDTLFVGKLSAAAWHGLSGNGGTWLKQHI